MNLFARHAADPDIYEVCEGGSITLDITGIAERIRGHAADWQSLALSWTEREISDYGKATTGARFEGAGWIGEISVWVTGETDLETVRISDGRGVNLNYDLADAADVEDVLSELVGLIRDGTLPPDAFTYPAP
jgi:hypothetical protein